MKKVLPQVVSWNQSPFIPERLITDNIIIDYEALHIMKTRKRAHAGSMTIKLDMSKAYDKVEWGYLKAVMVKLGFGEHWIQLVMQCVTTIHYSILVNRIPKNTIIPIRGLRQGDLLSPYLFLLCAEGLSCLVNKVEREGNVRGISISNGGTRVNHLLFTYDCILFSRSKL